MATQAQGKRPQFFKVLFPDPFTNQMIPRNFHEHLPHELRKTATLVSPHGKYWHVQIIQIGEDIYFQKGWLEFAKAYNLGKGYLMIFRYEGNMIFNVKIFDTTCCLQDYSLTNCTMPMWTPTSALPLVPEPAPSPVPVCHHVPASARARARAPSPSSHHATIASANACAGVPVAAANGSTGGPASCAPVPSSASALAPNRVLALSCSLDRDHGPIVARVPAACSADRASASVPVPAHYLASSPASNLAPSLSMSLASIPGPAPRQCYIQIEESSEALEVKLEDSGMEISSDSFVKSRKLSNGKRQIVKMKACPTSQKEAQGKRSPKIKQEILDIGEEWAGETHVLADTPNGKRKLSNGKSKSITIKRKKPILHKFEKKKNREICPHSSSYKQFEKILTAAAVTYNTVSIPKSFCLKNGFTTRTIFLKRKLEKEGKILLKEWPVQIILRPSAGQLGSGWKDFTTENGLRRGDKCIFKLVSKDTILVSTVSHTKLPEEIVAKREFSSIGTSKKKKLVPTRAHSKSFARSDKIMAPRKHWNGKNRAAEKTETWTVVRQYHITHKYMSLSRGYCRENMPTSKCKMILKDLEGNEWHINYFSNRLKEGRFGGPGWRSFSKENGLKEGDICNFKLVEEKIMLVHVAKG